MVFNGSLTSKCVNFESGIEANGTVSLVDSKVKGEAIFSGKAQEKR